MKLNLLGCFWFWNFSIKPLPGRRSPPPPQKLGGTGPTRRETEFQTAQQARLDDSSHPLHGAVICLLANALDGAGQGLRILVNEASRIERTQHLYATPHSAVPSAWTQANSFKNKTLLTRLGEVTYEVPQMRSGDLYPSALERTSRSEQAMN